MSDNPSPFHIAANPRDTAESVARRYRAAFGLDAAEKASEDEDKAETLGLKIRRALVDRAFDILHREDVANGTHNEWGDRI